MAGEVSDPRYKRLIARLRDARLAAGLSQEELGQRLGSRQQFVSKYEGGERRLDVIEFIDIAQQLGLDRDALLAACVRGED